MRDVIDGIEFFSDFCSANLGSVKATGKLDDALHMSRITLELTIIGNDNKSSVGCASQSYGLGMRCRWYSERGRDQNVSLVATARMMAS